MNRIEVKDNLAELLGWMADDEILDQVTDWIEDNFVAKDQA